MSDLAFPSGWGLRWGAGVLVLTLGSACAPRPAAEGERSAPRAPAALAEARLDDPPVTVQVVDIRRVSPEEVTVTFALVNPDGRHAVAPGRAFAAGDADGESMAGVSLLDEAGQKRYFVLRDVEGKPLCSGPIGPIPPGGQQTTCVRFPAPPEGVRAITVQVPHAAPFRNVPLPDARHRN